MEMLDVSSTDVLDFAGLIVWLRYCAIFGGWSYPGKQGSLVYLLFLYITLSYSFLCYMYHCLRILVKSGNTPKGVPTKDFRLD